MTVENDLDDQLQSEAARFAASCTSLVQSVIRTPCPEFRADGLQGSSVFYVKQESEFIPLEREDGEPILSLQARFDCRLGAQDRRMKILNSGIRVFPVADGSARPLVRYDFVEDPAGDIPAAHVQFHAPHPDLARAMARADGGTRRGKNRQRAIAKGKSPDASELHFPVGGRRFRPTLEDVLEMLIVEFGIRCVDGWHDAIAESRQRFRSIQLRAAVRDAPREAARELRSLGYQVDWTGVEAEPEGAPNRMREI